MVPSESPTLDHGLRTTYRQGCRCLLCRAANAEYECRRRAREDEAPEYVPADDARSHLRRLADQGVGYRQAARLAGLSIAEVRAVRAGRRPMIRPETEDCILAVRASLAAGQRVSAWPTWRLIHSLTKEGFTLGALALRLGLHTAHLQYDHGQVTVRTAIRVKSFYEAINLEGPEEAAS